MITYEELEDRDGTIYKKGTDEAYGQGQSPEEAQASLASDLGIAPHEIDWGSINKYVPPKEIPAGATVEDILGSDAYGDELAGAEAGYYETLTPEYGTELREQSDADIMKKYQQEIDALEAERVAARGRITSQYGQIGKERQGTSTAIQARRGLVGSTFGTQQKREVATQTQREQDAAMAYSSAQYSERKRAIMGQVRTAQADEAKLRLEAAQLGSQAKIEEIRGRKTRSDERISNAVKNMLGMDIDVEDEETMAEVAEGLGISVKDLMSKYSSAKSEAEEAAIDIELERRKKEADIEKAGKTTLSPGQKLYDSEGNIIAEGEGKTVTLSEGQILYDTNGEIIAMGQPKANTKTVTAGGRTLLIDERTGETIKDLGSAYKPSGRGEGEDEKIVKWSQEVEDAGLTGKPQWMVDDIFNLTSPPDWFNQSMEEEFQMSKDWKDEWTEARDEVLAVYSGKGEGSGRSLN